MLGCPTATHVTRLKHARLRLITARVKEFGTSQTLPRHQGRPFPLFWSSNDSEQTKPCWRPTLGRPLLCNCLKQIRNQPNLAQTPGEALPFVLGQTRIRNRWLEANPTWEALVQPQGPEAHRPRNPEAQKPRGPERPRSPETEKTEGPDQGATQRPKAQKPTSPETHTLEKPQSTCEEPKLF